MSDILEDINNNRVDNVRTMASRLAKCVQGYSVREVLDALALAGGALIKAAYRGPGVEVAVRRFVEALCRATQ